MARIDRENPIPRPPYRAGQVWVNVINGVGVLCTATDVFDPTWAHSVDCRAVTDCPSMVLLCDPFGSPWAPCDEATIRAKREAEPIIIDRLFEIPGSGGETVRIQGTIQRTPRAGEEP